VNREDVAAAADVLSANGVDIDDLALDLSDIPPDEDQEEMQKTLWNWQPSEPVPNPKHDHFLRAIAQGTTRSLAYMEHVNPQATKKTAIEQASRLVKRARYQERLRYLILSKKVDETKKATTINQAGSGAGGEGMTKAGLIAVLEGIVETSGNENNRMVAIEKLSKLKGFIKDQESRKDIPDPAFLAAFLKRAEDENRDPVELAKEASE
jgi:hypothetical protein